MARKPVRSGQKPTPLGGIETAAKIINLLGGQADAKVLDAIRDLDGELAKSIENLMFVFDDLVRLDDQGIRVLLKNIDPNELLVALRGADGLIKEKIMANLPKRIAEDLHARLGEQGPLRKSDVDSARKSILATLRRLVEAGQIVLDSSGDEYI